MESNRLSWSVILIPALTAGPLFAVLSIVGWIHGWENAAAVAVLIFAAGVVAFRCPRRHFLQGFLAGFLAWLVAVWLQALFLGTYFENNPGYEDTPIPLGLNARLATFVLGPVVAAVVGLIVGLLAWLAARVIGLRSRTD